MGGRGSLRGDGAWGKGGGGAGGLEQGSWGLGRVSKGLGAWGLERAEGLGSGGGGGWTLRGRDGCLLERTLRHPKIEGGKGKFEEIEGNVGIRGW